MVSIPDWSRFRGLAPESPTKDIVDKNFLYHKQREEKTIREAEESGYFTEVNREFLEKRFFQKETENKPEAKRSFLDDFDKKEYDLGVINLIKLQHHRLRTVGEIFVCRNLTICTLSNNFIIKIDGISSCVNLVKLDLHSNQISMLPGAQFWSEMPYLLILNLHDNPIGRIENLYYLAASPKLAALTLYDTPLSLKKNYRHHVVNSVWTLKALDNYVVSDEEIIEDADFGGRFSTLHPSFAVDLCIPLPEESAFDEEFEVITETLADINHILAHNSPVLIIQRYMRGYLLRKRLNIAYTKRTWGLKDSQPRERASEKIQRKYKGYRTKDGVVHEPPPPSPNMEQKHLSQVAPAESVRDSVKLDYDTYMCNRRPGSTALSEASVSARNAKQLEYSESKHTQDTGYLPETPLNSAKSDGDHSNKRKNIFINLAKLHAGTLQSLNDESLAFDLATDRSYMSQETTKLMIKEKTKKKKDTKRKILKSVKQFFGPVVETVSTPESEMTDAMEDDENIPMVNFRLRGMKQRVKYYDPTTDMILAKRDAGKDIRAAEDEYHTKVDYSIKPVKKRQEKKDSLSAEQRIFARVQGTMGLSCLHAVQQAYKDREKAEKRANKLEYVMNLKEQKEYSKERIRLYHEEKRNKTLKEREREQKRLVDALDKKEIQRMSSMENYHDKQHKLNQYQKQRRGEMTFISDFNTQNTSVSNALLRHDRQAKYEDKLNDQEDTVRAHKDKETEQRDVVQKYLEHRNLMRQTETAMARAALDTKMLQEANDRLMEARTRVAQQKALSAQVNNLYSKASVSSHSLPPMSADKVRGMKGLDRWNTSVYINQGHVGRHATSVTM